MTHYFLGNFCTMVDNCIIYQSAQYGPKIFFLGKRWLVLPGINLKWKLILLLIFLHQSHIWQNVILKLWFSSHGPKCYRQIKLQDSLKYNISRMMWMIKFIFGMQIRSCWSLQYLQKNMEDEVDLLHKDKHKRFLQCNSVTLHLYSQACASTSNNKFAVPLQYL